MGRVKLKIRRLESLSKRKATYGKRKAGLLKKAQDLSIVCDIDILLLMFHPDGRPTVFHGERSSIEQVISKFAQLSPQERTRRKLERLEILKKTYKTDDHDVNIHEFLGARDQTIEVNQITEGLSNQVASYQAQLSECHRRLSCWKSIDRIENIEILNLLEESLRGSLERTRIQKEHVQRNQLLPIECTTTQLPLAMGGDSSMQEANSMSWLFDNDNQQTILPGDSSFPPHRDMDGSIPFYSSCFFEHLEQQGGLGLQQLLEEEYPYPTPFGTTLGIEEWNNLQQQQQLDPPIDPTPFGTTLGIEGWTNMQQQQHDPSIDPTPFGTEEWNNLQQQQQDDPSIDRTPFDYM